MSRPAAPCAGLSRGLSRGLSQGLSRGLSRGLSLGELAEIVGKKLSALRAVKVKSVWEIVVKSMRNLYEIDVTSK